MLQLVLKTGDVITAVAKKTTHKRTRHLEGQIKALKAEIKRLKKEPLDKDEFIYDEQGNDIEVRTQPCVHCQTGFMNQIEVVGKLFWKCSTCLKTKKL